MIRERKRIPELEYVFKHQLTQEAAYASLLKRERRIYHRQVAEALEQLFANRLEEHLELLADHWQQAEDGNKAIDYLVRAGCKAAEQYANTEALAHFQGALALAEGTDRYHCDVQQDVRSPNQELIAEMQEIKWVHDYFSRCLVRFGLIVFLSASLIIS